MILQVKPYMRAWVTDLAQKVAAAIGWPDTLKAIEIGMEYAKANPFPDDPDKVPSVPPAVEPPAAGEDKPKDTPAPAKSKNFRHLRGTYVQWDDCPRDGWPEKDNGKTVNGLLFGCLVGGEPKKIEWIPKGRENTGWQNVYGAKYGQAGWVKGARVHFEIRDINKKLRDPTYQGEMTLP